MAITADILGSLPHRTGVYIIRDSGSGIIYVGKAKDLRKRFSSYFMKDRQDAKVEAMLSKAASVETVITETEKEALILECNLIKRHHPKYNIVLRDDKNYLSLRLDPRERFPRITMVRRTASDGALYFGPYSSAAAIRDTLRTLQKIFPLRRCPDTKFGSRIRPCLNYQMKRCLAPCTGAVSDREYRKMVDQVVLFFRGRLRDLIGLMEKEMHHLAEHEEYEAAALYRDRIAAVRKSLEKQNVISPSLADEDVIGLARQGERVQMSVLFVRNGALVGHKSLAVKNPRPSEGELLSGCLMQFYSEEKYIPKHILVPFEVEDKALIAAFLGEAAKKKVSIAIPKRGEQRSLLHMAMENALQGLEQGAQNDNDTSHLLERLQQSLKLFRLPAWIEAFDISNIGGTLAVGSVVAFVNGKPERSLYRRYRIRLPEHPNDYLMIHELIDRRLSRAKKENSLPDLLLIDGGKGQLNVAVSVSQELGLEKALNIVSLAKGEKNESDKLYLPFRKNPVHLDGHLPLLLYLQRIRDEAHRFAIEYHRRLREKRMAHSLLDEIPGVGRILKKRLLTHFGNVKRIREASIQELASVQGIHPALARQIKDFLALKQHS